MKHLQASKSKVTMSYIIFAISTTTFFVLLCSPYELKGTFIMIIFIILACISVLFFILLLAWSQAFRNFIKAFFGLY